jgi:hypothetical protein
MFDYFLISNCMRKKKVNSTLKGRYKANRKKGFSALGAYRVAKDFKYKY